MSKEITEKLEEITDAIDSLDTSSNITTGFDTETFNMLAFSLSELAENTKRIASALERMEEA